MRVITVSGAALVLCAGLLALAAHAGERPHVLSFDTSVRPAPSLATLPDPLVEDDFPAVSPEKVELGRLLFHDKILSGNRNISCASCHHALTDTGDGLSLPIGEGGCGMGMVRDCGSGVQAVVERVPRNAPPVFNLGHIDVRTLFHDGRVAADPLQSSGFASPAGDYLPEGLDDVLAVQAMFPVTSAIEMAGQLGENPVADAAGAGDLLLVWELLANRLRDIDEYAELFQAAFADVSSADDITYVHAANAIAAFEGHAWRAIDTPFDRFISGEVEAMSASAQAGMELFFGGAGCAACHSGPLLSDQEFHAIAMPQIGPGKGDGSDGHEDFGRERVTGQASDRYRFRTLPLRNVALTGPWGHDGAYNTLEGVVRHHLDPVAAITTYDAGQAVLPSREDLDELDFIVQSDPDRVAAIAASCELASVQLSDPQVGRLIDFLHALTDPASLDLRADVPKRLPSGLPLAECVFIDESLGDDEADGEDDGEDDAEDDADQGGNGALIENAVDLHRPNEGLLKLGH